MEPSKNNGHQIQNFRDKHGKSVGNMRKFIEIDQPGINSQTCSTKLKSRQKGLHYEDQTTSPFYCSVKSTQISANFGKLNESAKCNQPFNKQQTLFPIPDKHLANNNLDNVHTTRRTQVLNQNVNENESPDQRVKGLLPQEKVFLRTSPKPILTSQTSPD